MTMASLEEVGEDIYPAPRPSDARAHAHVHAHEWASSLQVLKEGMDMFGHIEIVQNRQLVHS